MRLSKKTESEIRRHAEREYPNEACGLVVSGEYRPMPNLAVNKAESFKIDTNEILDRLNDKTLDAIVHSHPGGNEYPSEADMKSQIASRVGAVIVCSYKSKAGEVYTTEPFFWGGKFDREPLRGRKFRHGVTDCLSIIRDWYLECRGIELPDFAREWRWWVKGADLYQRYYQQAGFRASLPGEKLKEGDVWFAALPDLGSPDSRKSYGVITHGGIYLGNGWILHHDGKGQPFSQELSVREPGTRILNNKTFYKGFVRFEGLPDGR